MVKSWRPAPAQLRRSTPAVDQVLAPYKQADHAAATTVVRCATRPAPTPQQPCDDRAKGLLNQDIVDPMNPYQRACIGRSEGMAALFSNV